MRFEWDDRKAEMNLRKHGIDFETAAMVFDDPWQLPKQDREVDGEARWQTLGMAGNELLLLMVAHTVDEDGHEEVIRIISARRAKAVERREYERSL